MEANVDDLVKSHETDDSLAERNQGMTKDELHHRRWTFYEIVNIGI